MYEGTGRFRNLFEIVPCYISIQDREFHVIEGNRRFQETFGRRIGDHCYEIYKKRTERCPSCPVALTFEDGKTHTSEEVLIDDEGHQVHVVVHTAPVRDTDGEIVAAMEVSDDITEMRALEDKLASLGRLVGGTAHSIKNILEGLRGGIYIGNLGFRDNNIEDIRTGWQMVERNVGRLSGMILDMLYCAKDRSPRHLPISLANVARELTETHPTRAAQHSIALESHLDGNLGIVGEPKDIHSLLSNLLGNAIDACLSGQTEDRAYRIALRLFSQDGHAVIEVEDNGAGMDEETRAKLFTMFFSTKGTFGTGLGLLVAHKVVTEHGGSIAVRSQPGEGSVFTVRLPLAQDSGAGPPLASPVGGTRENS